MMAERLNLTEKSNRRTSSKVHSFALWFALTFNFSLSFVRRFSIPTWSDTLVKEFRADATKFSILSVGYYYAYAAFQIPSGIMMDLTNRWHLIIPGCILICVGSMLFALSTSLPMATFARVVIGLADGPTLLIIVDLCNKKFPHTASTLVGTSIALAVACGFMGQAPNALLTERIGWRAVELCLFGLQVLNLITLIVLWINECSHNNKHAKHRQNQPEFGAAKMVDRNPSHRAITKSPSASVDRVVVTACRKPRHVKVEVPEGMAEGTALQFDFQGRNYECRLPEGADQEFVAQLPERQRCTVTCRRMVWDIASNSDNWVLAAGSTVFELIIFTFTSLWAVPYLETLYGMTTAQAAGLNSVMLISWGVANPLWGLLYDRTNKWSHNDRAVLGGASVLGFVATCVMFIPQVLLPVPLIIVIFIAIGASSPLGVLLTTAHNRNPPHVGSLAAAIANTCVVLSGGIFQQVYGLLLEFFDSGIHKNNKGNIASWSGGRGNLRYSESAYRRASYMFPIGVFLSSCIFLFGLKCVKPPDGSNTESEKVL